MREALELIIQTLDDYPETHAVLAESEESEIHAGFAARLRGDPVTDRGLDNSSHYWKAGWRACDNWKKGQES